jgi:hypothetical protein
VSGRLALVAGALLFIVVATANSGGYRYGVSDQAFYASAAVKDLHPSFFPRDTPLIETQSNLMRFDEIIGGLSRLLGLDLPPLFFGLYIVTLAVMFIASVAFARSLGLSWWAVAILIVLLTLRHRIARTGANSLEGYMHPRELAFALGIAALACLIRARLALVMLFLVLAASWHPTTAIWFSIACGVWMITRRTWNRGWILTAGVALVGLALWALFRGPLAGRLVTMDAAWLAVLADKDYLFPHQWPAYAWIANLAYPVVISAIGHRRKTLGVAVPGEWELVLGLWALVGIFLVSVPLTIWHVALAVQLQITRVFWVLDFVTAAYLAWWIADDLLRDRTHARQIAVAVLAALAIGRGGYLAFVQEGRRLVTISLPQSRWIDAMDWLKGQPSGLYVLADPGHAWKYGVSVRLAAEKDTLVEAGKDTALAIYDRNIAMRVADRLSAVSDFDRLTPASARSLRARYGLDVVIVDAARPLDLPVLYRNPEFVIYDLR